MNTSTSYMSRRILLAFSILFIGFGSLYAQFTMPGTLYTSKMPGYPIVESKDVKGGFQQVTTIENRNLIGKYKREPGMLCLVWDAGSGVPKTYRLVGGIENTNWEEYTYGSASASFSNITGLPTTLAGYGITDGMSTAHPANGITALNITNWNSAFGWGAHAGLYRPISYVPAWSEITANPFSLAAVTVADGQLLKYNGTTLKWENWTPNYVTAASETDPLFTAWNKSTGISITASQVSDFQASVTGNAAVTANTAKITNADHIGDVTGAQALTITDKAVTLSKMADIATARILGRNAANAGSPEALDAATVKAMLNIAENVSFPIDRPITLSGNNNTGKNLGAGGKTMSQFFEAFFFPSVAATPPTNTFTTVTIPLTVPYATWSTWNGVNNPPSKNITFDWGVTNNSMADNSDDKAILSINLKDGATVVPASPGPTGASQTGNFPNIAFANPAWTPMVDFSKTYTLEVKDAQPNTVLSNITLTMSKAIPLTYGAPTLTPATLVYEYENANKDITLNWSITPNDEGISSISVNGTLTGSNKPASGSQGIQLKSIPNGGTQTQAFPLIVTGSIYGAGASKNSPVVSWENRLYSGIFSSPYPPNDSRFTFTDDQVKALTVSKLGGDWKAAGGYQFNVTSSGNYLCFAYPDDNLATTFQAKSDMGFLDADAAGITVITRPNFVNQFNYSGTNYKLVFYNNELPISEAVDKNAYRIK